MAKKQPLRIGEISFSVLHHGGNLVLENCGRKCHIVMVSMPMFDFVIEDDKVNLEVISSLSLGYYLESKHHRIVEVRNAVSAAVIMCRHIRHVPEWNRAMELAAKVKTPGGRFWTREMFRVIHAMETLENAGTLDEVLAPEEWVVVPLI